MKARQLMIKTLNDATQVSRNARLHNKYMRENGMKAVGYRTTKIAELKQLHAELMWDVAQLKDDKTEVFMRPTAAEAASAVRTHHKVYNEAAARISDAMDADMGYDYGEFSSRAWADAFNAMEEKVLMTVARNYGMWPSELMKALEEDQARFSEKWHHRM